MDTNQKEAMAVAMELKHLLSLRLCNEITDEQYQSQRQRLLKDFNRITKKVMLYGKFDSVLWPAPAARSAERVY